MSYCLHTLFVERGYYGERTGILHQVYRKEGASQQISVDGFHSKSFNYGGRGGVLTVRAVGFTIIRVAVISRLALLFKRKRFV